MSPPAASLASHLVQACERDRFAAASILLSMSHEEPQPDVDTSDEQLNCNDAANAHRKGQPWTEEEHLAFLQGLRKLGKGNWRAIAKSFVPSRTPTQVASHAQKHFMRVAGATKRKSRFTALEVEVGGPTKRPQAGESPQLPQGNEQCAEQAMKLQTSSFQGFPAQFPAMPFPFMHPMMFAFPGPFFPPFLCPPPAFSASVLSGVQKEGTLPMMFPPMFPMAAAMMAMNPFFMAQQMSAVAQAAAANAAAAAHAATSGGGRTAGTGPTATTDTANSDDVPRQSQSGTPGSPAICKPEAQHAQVTRPPIAGVVAAAGAEAALPCGASRNTPPRATASGSSEEGGAVSEQPRAPGGDSLAEHAPLQLLPSASARSDDGVGPFQTSSHSAFRPPQVR